MKFKLVILFLFASIGLNAQVIFKNIKWDEAVKLAQQEGKSIFVDAYRSKPEDKVRKQVYNTVFKDKQVSELMNANFISIKIDMSTEEGMAFAPKLYSLMYPCMVFYSSNEDQMIASNAYTIVKDKNILIDAAKKSIEKAKVKSVNSRKILFSHTKFEDALKEAKKQNKLVFIDAYTSWCRPCAEMVMNIFNLNNVADFYNENFINLKIDFYKERPDLSKKYNVHGFPAFLFIDSDGKLVNMEGGYTEAEKFISYGKNAIKKFSGIKFAHTSFDNAIEKAKKENKMIFIDCYTSWCGPCKMLAKDVFTKKNVGDFFNENFVSLKLDMEKEGKSLKKFLGVNAYPTLVFMNADKQIVHKVVGGMSDVELLAEATLATAGKGIILYENKFATGERDSDFLIDYLKMLEKANQKETIAKVAATYFNGVKKKDLLSERNWELIDKYITNYNSREFKYLVSKKKKFIEKYGAKKVDNKIFYTFLRGANGFIVTKNNQKALDVKAYNHYMKFIKRKHYESYVKIKFYSESNNALELCDWQTYVSLIDEAINTKSVETGDMAVYNWALRVNQGCKDKELRLVAANWARESAKKGSFFKDPFLKIAKELEK